MGCRNPASREFSLEKGLPKQTARAHRRIHPCPSHKQSQKLRSHSWALPTRSALPALAQLQRARSPTYLHAAQSSLWLFPGRAALHAVGAAVTYETSSAVSKNYQNHTTGLLHQALTLLCEGRGQPCGSVP